MNFDQIAVEHITGTDNASKMACKAVYGNYKLDFFGIRNYIRYISSFTLLISHFRPFELITAGAPIGITPHVGPINHWKIYKQTPPFFYFFLFTFQIQPTMYMMCTL